MTPESEKEFRTQPEQTPADYGIQTWEEVIFPSQGGLQLAGWFFPPAKDMDGATIINVHGLGSNREDLLEQAALLSRQGYGELLFDLRNHGNNSEHQIIHFLHGLSRGAEAVF